MKREQSHQHKGEIWMSNWMERWMTSELGEKREWMVRERERRRVCHDDSPWLRSTADESCLDSQLPWRPAGAARGEEKREREGGRRLGREEQCEREREKEGVLKKRAIDRGRERERRRT